MGKKKVAFDADERTAFLRQFHRSHQDKVKIQRKRQRQAAKPKSHTPAAVPAPTSPVPSVPTKPVYKDSMQEVVDDRTGEVVEVSTTLETPHT